MEMMEPQCHKRNCKHFEGLEGPDELPIVICAAYPKGIPNSIAYGDDLHLTPRPGDHGIQFEEGE